MASGRRQPPRSLAARLLESSFHASFGGFLLWLVWVVVRAPAAHLVTALVGKIAFALTVGTVATGWLLLALMTLTGIDEVPPLPDALAELCPGCGNHLPASPGDCSRCGLASSHARRWHAARPGGVLGLLRLTRDLRRPRREPHCYQVQTMLVHHRDVPYIQATAQIDGAGQLVHAEGWSAHHDSAFRWTRRAPLAAGVDYRHEPREMSWQCDETSRREAMVS